MINPDQWLSEHFRLSECAVSAEYPEDAARTEFSVMQIERAKWFFRFIIEALRDLFGWIKITSANRSTFNSKVSTNRNSDHLWRDSTESLAIDISCEHIGKAFEWLVARRDLFKMVYFDTKKNFIHIACRDKTGIKGVVFIKSSDGKHYL